MSQLVFDAQAAERIEALYLIGDAIRRRRIVREALGASPGEKILDVGCGPGFYCAELLAEVGPSGHVVGIDSSAAMLALAARRCAGHDNVELLEAEAVGLPVEDASFDAVLSVQVQEYVGDVRAGLAELHRALRPGGRALVWDVDWATLSVGGEPDLTARVLRAWDEHLAHPSLPRALAPLLRSAGFEEVRMQAHPFATSEFDLDSLRRRARAVHRCVRGRPTRDRRVPRRRPGSPSNERSAIAESSSSRALSSASRREGRGSGLPDDGQRT